MRKLIVPLVLCIFSVTGVAQVQWNDMPLSPGTFSDATTPTGRAIMKSWSRRA